MELINSLAQLLEEFFHDLRELGLDQIRVDAFQLCNALLILTERLLEFDIELLADERNEFDPLELVFEDALVAHYGFGLRNVADVDFAMLRAPLIRMEQLVLQDWNLLPFASKLSSLEYLHHPVG